MYLIEKGYYDSLVRQANQSEEWKEEFINEIDDLVEENTKLNNKIDELRKEIKRLHAVNNHYKLAYEPSKPVVEKIDKAVSTATSEFDAKREINRIDAKLDKLTLWIEKVLEQK